MAGWFNSAMSWLGLVDDLQDDDTHYAGSSYSGREAVSVEETIETLQQADTVSAAELPPNVTKITDINARRAAELRVVPRAEPRPAQYEKPVILHAFSYADMELIGKQFRSGKAIVMNLAGMSDRKEMRRLIDFSSGMVYALNGRAEKLADRMFLLTPHGVEVAGDFLTRLGAEVARSA
jgi:cell division inhibitor SepF